MKTKTINAETPELLDEAINEVIKGFGEKLKRNIKIGIVTINYSTHVEEGQPVYTSQIVYIEESAFSIQSMRVQ